MPLSVRARADTVATLRHTSVYLMETLARWVPTSPEYEAKTLFGRHLWEFAQHADALGQRTSELRLGFHANRPPTEAYATILETVRASDPTPTRLTRMYDGIVPDLERRYRAYLEAVDHLMDEPTVRIVERAQTDLARMIRERDEVLTQRPDLAGPLDGGIIEALNAIEEIVDFRPMPAGAGS